MPIFVCWKRLVIFLIFGLWYVKIVHFLLLFPFFLDTGALVCVVFVLLDFLWVFPGKCCFVRLIVLASILFVAFPLLVITDASWRHCFDMLQFYVVWGDWIGNWWLCQLWWVFEMYRFKGFYGTRRFIIAFTSARHLSLSWASSIQSIPPHSISCSILILSSHLRLGLPSGLFPSSFPNETLYTTLLSPIRATCLPISFFSILSPEK